MLECDLCVMYLSEMYTTDWVCGGCCVLNIIISYHHISCAVCARLSSQVERQHQPLQQVPQNHIVYLQVTAPSSGRSNYDGSKGGSQVTLLYSNKHYGLFPVSNCQRCSLYSKQARDHSRTLTKCLLLSPWQQHSPNLNEVVTLTQTTVFP